MHSRLGTRGADDAIFLSEDGLVLEGNNINLIAYNKGAFYNPMPSDNEYSPRHNTEEGCLCFWKPRAKKHLRLLSPLRHCTIPRVYGLLQGVRMIAGVVSVDGNRVRSGPGFDRLAKRVTGSVSCLICS